MDNSNGFIQPDQNGIDLTQFDDDFEKAEVEEHEFELIDDGRYQVNVERVELTRAKSSGNPMLKWTLRILGPRFRGRIFWRNNVMATSANIKWLKTDLYTCGLNLQKLSDLSNTLDQLIDVKLEVYKRTRGENENIYFNKRVEINDEYTPDANNAELDDIPF